MVLLLGLIAGFIHTFSGPDHLSAIAPYALSKGRKSWPIGVQWGLGHTGGMILVGLAAVALRHVLPVQHFSNLAEKLVGITLIGIGLWGVRRGLRTSLHAHEHVHDGDRHVHIHTHAPETERHAPEDTWILHRHPHPALGIGLLHGLAGGSHFLAVLPVLALPSGWSAGLYMAGFGIGTIAAMALFSGFMGLASASLRARAGSFYKYALCGTSSLAVLVGIHWLTQV